MAFAQVKAESTTTNLEPATLSVTNRPTRIKSVIRCFETFGPEATIPYGKSREGFAKVRR